MGRVIANVFNRQMSRLLSIVCDPRWARYMTCSGKSVSRKPHWPSFESKDSSLPCEYCTLDTFPVKRRSRIGKGLEYPPVQIASERPMLRRQNTSCCTYHQTRNEAASTTRKHFEFASGYPEKSSDQPHVLLFYHSHIV